MTTNAQNCTYTTPHGAVAHAEAEHEDPTSNLDSSPPPQAELIPVAPCEGDTKEADLNGSLASGAEPMTKQEPVIPGSKRATAITDMWPTHAYIEENDFKYKSLSNWSLNSAIGCTHGCLFCYVPGTSANKQARPLSKLGVDDPDAQWGQYVFVREWDETKFLASLRTAENKAHEDLKKDGNRAVMLCTTTDPYQTIKNADLLKQKN
jgi:hypothetical protein